MTKLTIQSYRELHSTPLIRTITTITDAIINHRRRHKLPMPTCKILVQTKEDPISTSICSRLITTVQTIAVIVIYLRKVDLFFTVEAGELMLIIWRVERNLLYMNSSNQIYRRCMHFTIQLFKIKQLVEHKNE